MPKKSNKPFWGGRGRANNHEEKHYFAHDDRMNRPNDGQKNYSGKPRVSFKKQSFKPSRPKSFVKRTAMDDDVLMSAGSNNNTRQVVTRGRGRGFSRGRNSPMPHGDFRDYNRSRVPLANSDWYKIFIPRSDKYSKEFVLGNLQTYMALPPTLTFNPVMYTKNGTSSMFYVEDYKVAAKLAECDRRITTNDGFKLQVSVKAITHPPYQVCDALKERLKVAMGKRYLQETNALDLSKFHQDPDLAADFYCPLNQRATFSAVMDIVQEHIPHLGALNLDSNKIYNLEKLGSLAEKFTNLKILHIGYNKIKEINILNQIKNLPIEELQLEGNPVCHRYKNQNDDYISDVRKIFPKLLKLDGKELPPPIVFDLDDQKLKLPSTQRMFIAQSNAKAQEIASQFLKQYFTIFDSDNRQPLLDAYHEHACFSMTTFIPSSGNKYSPFLLHENRNLKRVTDPNRRRKLLKQGRLQIVSFISEMPHMQHDLNSFTMDLSLVTDKMMLITVTGLCKELPTKNNKEQLRYFNRTFIIVPEGAGFCISNEQLHFGSPTPTQEKEFSYVPVAVQPTPGPSTVPAASINPLELTEQMKQQMVTALSQETNMNIEWSIKCLDEVKWNYEAARSAFSAAFAADNIPPNAFNK